MFSPDTLPEPSFHHHVHISEVFSLQPAPVTSITFSKQDEIKHLEVL